MLDGFLPVTRSEPACSRGVVVCVAGWMIDRSSSAEQHDFADKDVGRSKTVKTRSHGSRHEERVEGIQ
jgi:hypothetical protein